MNVKELQIGDLINHLNNPRRIKGAIDFTFAKDFEPIPLTAEILEKNGFELTKSGDFYKLIDSNFDWSVEISNNDNRIGYVSGDGSVTKRFNYAHELQHALRLCELNDLADNFKV